jgi:hypothetical protein
MLELMVDGHISNDQALALIFPEILISASANICCLLLPQVTRVKFVSQDELLITQVIRQSVYENENYNGRHISKAHTAEVQAATVYVTLTPTALHYHFALIFNISLFISAALSLPVHCLHTALHAAPTEFSIPGTDVALIHDS